MANIYPTKTVNHQSKTPSEETKMQVENPLQGLVWKLLLVNTLSCGLEVCIAAGTVYVPPLLLQAGMEERYMTMVLGKWVTHTHWVTMGGKV